MELAQLRTDKEARLFPIAAVVSGIIWAVLVIGTLGIGLVYIVFGTLFYLMAHALFLAGIKGNGVRITKDQLPELYERIANASRRLGLNQPPDAYLLNHRGVFNAFATRFLGRDFIVLYAELLENSDEQNGSIDFVIGHEIAHHAFGHLRRNPFLLPSRLVPLLGPAYSRACEYSCDRAGLEVVGNIDSAIAGLAVLAAGGRYAKRLNVQAYLQQRLETGTFWMAVLELGMSHPYLPKRVGALIERSQPALVPAVPRNPAAYVLAPFFGFAAAGAGGAASVMMTVAIIGILAAIAIPNFIRYQERAKASRQQAIEQQQQLNEKMKEYERGSP
jgi:Zn-dependent protease with chaperone function